MSPRNRHQRRTLAALATQARRASERVDALEARRVVLRHLGAPMLPFAEAQLRVAHARRKALGRKLMGVL